MNIILFDGNSTSPISQIIAVAPGDCVLLNSWGLGPGELAQVYRALIALGNIPAQQSGSCLPPPQVTPALIQNETPYFPCNVTVGVGQQPDMNQTSIVIQQPGFYRVHLTPAALGNATVEAVVLTGAEACQQAADQCCCLPETFWSGSSLNPCLTITPGGEAGHSPVFNLDACCLLHAFPGLPVPQLTDELIVLSGGACFRSTIAQVFDPAIICTTLGTYLLQLPVALDTLVVIDAGANCKRVDGETFVEFFETPWTGISVTPALTIAPGGINGHGPTFAYDLCADLQAIPACACEPVPGDLVPIIQGGACVLAQWPEVDACAQMGGFAVGALIAGDNVFVREAGGACKQVPAADFLATPFPLLAPDGSCVSPSYSFTSSPDSGMFYDPAGVGSVVIGDDNCADFISIGASILLQTAASNITANAGVDFVAVGANDATLQATAGTARMLGAGGNAVVQIDPVGNITAVNSTGAALRVLSTGSAVAMTAGLSFEITLAGEILVNANPGVATEVLTSSGPGLPPVWAPAVAVVAFPVLAPDGSCLAPSYSFASSPDSGIFYDPAGVGSVVIGDDNCADFISVGASIAIQTAASNITLQSGNNITAQATANITHFAGALFTQTAVGNHSIFSTGGNITLDSAGSLIVNTATVTRFAIGPAGTWAIGGLVGAAGQVVTSNGLGLPPTWQTIPAPTFPLLAPNGSCAAPSYSFTASPDSGMFYDLGAGGVIIGDDTCTSFVTVASGIDLDTAGSIVNTSTGLFVVNATGAVLITGAPSATLASSGGSVSMEAAVGGASFVTGAVLRFSIEPDGSWNIGGSNGTAGQALLSNGAATGPTWQTITGFATSAQMIWGAQSVGSAADTRVLPPGYDDALISTQTPKGYAAPRAGTFRNLRVRYNTANGNGNAAAFTLRVNGVLSALTVSRATGAIGTSSDLVNTVAVAAGDLIEMVCTKAVAIGSGVLEVICSAEFA